MSNIQTGAERMPHDLSHPGFLAGQIGRRITISTTPVIAGDSFGMDSLLILALLQMIFLMSSLMLLLVWLIFFMVVIKLLPILGTISGKTVKLMVLALICLGNNRQD